MQPLFRLILCLATVLASDSTGTGQSSDDQDRLRVGLQSDGRILVPTNQVLKPAGDQVTFPGRPVDLAFADNGQTLVAKSQKELVFIDLATKKVKQILRLRTGDSKLGFSVVGLMARNGRIYASDSKNHVQVASPREDGRYDWDEPMKLDPPKVGGDAHPAGMAFLGTNLWVTSTRGNCVQCLDLETGKVKDVVPVGVAPYAIICTPERCYVTNWGGDPPSAGNAQAKSADTPIRVDPRTRVANDGTVSILERVDGLWKPTRTIRVGLHPCGMAMSRSSQFVYVANANSDTVSVINTRKLEVVETIPCRPEQSLPFGSGSNAVVADRFGRSLWVANGTNNCVAWVQLSHKTIERPPPDWSEEGQVKGLIPTGWYPGAILQSPDGKKLYIANIKGHGSLSQPRTAAKGKNSHDYLGSVTIVDTPDGVQLARYTSEVQANNRIAYSLAGLEKPRSDAKEAVVPQRHGEPSVFQHVIYVIKENRTYDQVFGDMKEGNGDPNLVMFGEEVTPNHHALARQFTLFDNFYCSGVLSADGHSWVNEAYVTDYLERAFGGFTRSYPDDGSDPLAYPATGFLWDNVLARQKTLRNYGEFVNLDFAPKGATWMDYYQDFKTGKRKMPVAIHSNLASLQPYTHPHYPWFPLLMPDVYRAQIFLDELKEFEQKGAMPNLIYLTLPCDHTDGTRPGYPTPKAMVADNDLALGRIVEGVSRSKFWKDTCIFVVEDDPQDGFDHVDAHRTVALVISPYTRRGFVDHTNYNQTGMVKTIELLLGLPPMNQLDLSATPMRACFQSQPDLTPYKSLPNRIPLDQMNPPLEKLQGQALHWAKKSLTLNLDRGDDADEETLNRILWHATRGYETPYPDRYAGR